MQGYENVENAIRELIAELFPDVFIVEINLQRGPKNVLSIWIDTDEGITIDRVARIGRKINGWLEENDPFDFAFTIECSSPGLGRPLKILRQYHKNVGRKLKVKTTDGNSVVGKLESVSEEGIVLLPEAKTKKKKNTQSETTHISLAFDVIQEAKIEISFD
jgi:ribosome maturation factor RimP